MKIFNVILFCLLLLTAGCSKKEENVTEKKLYTCTMHPQVISDKPGFCPICHMALVEKKDNQSIDTSNLDIQLSANDIITANVETYKIVKKPLSYTINAYSTLEPAEDAKRTISSRFNGRIEKLYINKTGDYVKKGAPLFEIYSPDLIQAQKEYLIALNNDGTLVSSNSNNYNTFKESAEQKLLLLGFTKAQIKSLENTKKIKNTFTFYSPSAGTVIEKKIQEGMYVNEGFSLFDLTDFSTLWNIAQINEDEIASVRQGIVSVFTPEYDNLAKYPGKISYIYPVEDPQTKTIKVRSVITNKSNKLKPFMTGTSELHISMTSGLVIPEEAVILTGKRNIVYVQIGKNKFRQKEVILGRKFNAFYQVLSGLNENDIIASSGNFLIDSESQLRK